MHLIIDLKKSRIGLVQKEVLIRPQIGKPFIRKQWVRASEEPSAPEKQKKKSTKSTKDDVKLQIEKLRDKHGKDNVIELAKKQGISWKEDAHPGINWMRASMAIQKHLKEGNTFKESIDKPKIDKPKEEKTKDTLNTDHMENIKKAVKELQTRGLDTITHQDVIKVGSLISELIEKSEKEYKLIDNQLNDLREKINKKMWKLRSQIEEKEKLGQNVEQEKIELKEVQKLHYKSIEDIVAHRRVNKYKQRLKKIINEIRPLNTEGLPESNFILNKHMTNTKGIQSINRAVKNLPKDWVEETIKSYTFHAFYESGKRGSFSEYQRQIITHSDSTSLHELGHLLQYLNPNIRRIERQFLNERTKGEKLQRLVDAVSKAGYSEQEQTKIDKFVDPYMGKIYSSQTYTEIFSMGLEGVFERKYDLFKKDREMFNLIVGMIVTL